jgi:hypothetical protein
MGARRAHLDIASRARRAVALVVAPLVANAVFALACSGTTGREGLPTGTSGADGGTDSSLAGQDDAGTFDVVIPYADRVLPDVGAAAEAGSGGEGGGYPWPSCPPFIPVANGVPVPVGSSVNEIPAVYGDSGADGNGEVFAPDGSACATYGWLGSTPTDSCATSVGSGNDFIDLPPCNWCVDAGTATQGPGQGKARYELCLALYQCMMSTGCGSAAGTAVCLCGDAGGACIPQLSSGASPGPCTTEELSALEYPASAAQDALKNYQETTLPIPDQGSCGAPLNQVFQDARINKCFGK